MIDTLFNCEPWPHQRLGVEQTIAALSNGTKSVCLTSPTGSGKTVMEIALAKWMAEVLGGKVLCLTNRTLLTDQTRKVFQADGITTGVISASMKHLEREDAQVQVATIQTIQARQRSNSHYWVDADLVLADECHQLASGESADLLNAYKARGAKVVGVTATPLGVSNICDELIVAARTRDLQDDGILCLARWFAPSELDTRKLSERKIDLSISETDARKTWGPLKGSDAIRTKIVGNIVGHYQELHPTLTNTLAFAPGVKESIWAAQYCTSRGFRSMHVDGKDFWVDGVMYDRKKDERLFEDSRQAWREGDIKILWNRFVLREGIDERAIRCIILATPVGSFRSFLQMVGRGLRTHDSKEKCTVIDHGGCWWRHGSVNVNVDWESVFDCEDPDVISKNRIAAQREEAKPMGQVCPKCGMVHGGFKRFTVCQYCGHQLHLGKPSRPILQSDGTLRDVTGEPIEQWKMKNTPLEQKIWNGVFFNDKKNKGGESTFNQLFVQAHYNIAMSLSDNGRPAYWKAHYPARDLPNMPRNKNDWHRKVSEVPKERLY